MFGLYPNISGGLKAGGVYSSYDVMGALDGSKIVTGSNGASHNSVINSQILSLTFNASNANGLYGASIGVQPASQRFLACIKF